MGGGFSRQSLVDHAANYTFRPLRRKSDKSVTSNENNDHGGVNTESVSTPRRSTSKNQTSTMDEMSLPQRSTSNDHVVVTDSISSPRRSTSNDRVTTDCTPSARLLDNNERRKKDDSQSLYSADRTPQTISSSPPQSISSPPPSVSSPPQSISSPPPSISSPPQSISLPPPSISSPSRSISSPTITTPTAEIISKIETKESMNVFKSDTDTAQKKDQDKSVLKGIITIHDESDDDYGRRMSDYDGWVGSPSFREYCVNDYLKPDSSTCDGEMIDTKTKGVKEKEDLVPMSTKKWRRIRKIKKAISMGNPSGMKNILNVSACYSPANSAPHQKLVT